MLSNKRLIKDLVAPLGTKVPLYHFKAESMMHDVVKL